MYKVEESNTTSVCSTKTCYYIPKEVNLHPNEVLYKMSIENKLAPVIIYISSLLPCRRK